MRTLLVWLCGSASALLFTVPANADLLLSLTHRSSGVATGGFDPWPLVFSATVDDEGNPIAKLGSLYTPADVGLVVTASPEVVVGFQAALTAPTGDWISEVIGYGSVPHGEADSIWTSTLWTPHVPRRGNGLTGYVLTEVTQTIDYFAYEPHNGVTPNLTTPVAQHTIRFYGDVWSMGDTTGDFNGNGVVDAADYIAVRDTDDGPLERALAHSRWRAAFGTVPAQPASLDGGAVPEPSSILLLLLGAIHLRVGVGGVKRDPSISH